MEAGKLVRFFRGVAWFRMRPRDDLAAGSTRWVLADPGRAYVLYSYDAAGPMGLRQAPPGRCELRWFDPVSGEEVRRDGVRLAGGRPAWPKPPGFGEEAALYVRRVSESP